MLEVKRIHLGIPGFTRFVYIQVGFFCRVFTRHKRSADVPAPAGRRLSQQTVPIHRSGSFRHSYIG